MKRHARFDHLGRVGQQAPHHLVTARHGVIVAVKPPVDPGQHVGIVIGCAADHHTIQVGEMPRGIVQGLDAAVDLHGERRKALFQAIDHVVAERRHAAVLLRAQPAQYRDARVHGEARSPSLGDRLHKLDQFLEALPSVDADAALDRDRHIDRRAHGRDTSSDQGRLRHQTRTETALLHARARAADVQVDLVKARPFAHGSRLRQHGRVRAAELQRNGVLRRVERQQMRRIAHDKRVGMDHFRIEPNAPADQAQKIAVMPVGVGHHRRHRNQRSGLRRHLPTSKKRCIGHW